MSVNLLPLFRLVVERYALGLDGVHGVGHWGRVLENGRELARTVPADRDVLALFSIFHDSCRLSDGRDPDHGPRAAALLGTLRDIVPLDDRRFAWLVEACDCHTRGTAGAASETVMACLDADRLDIPRVGMRVNPGLLSTAAARDVRVIEWASGRAARRDVPAVCRDEWNWEG